MIATTTTVLFAAVAMVTCARPGRSNSEDWAYIWYANEPFTFIYIRGNASDTRPLRVEWETPSTAILKDNNTSEFELFSRSQDGIDNNELLIKKITPSLHGVYISRAYDKGTSKLVERKLFGINIRFEKHDNMREEYHARLMVAGIASGVFLVPLLTACVTVSFRYEERHGYYNRKRKYEVTSVGQSGNATGVNGMAAGEPDAAGHDNPSFNTPM